MRPSPAKKQHHRDHAETQESAQRSLVSLGDGVDHFVHSAEEPALLAVGASEQDRRKSRSQSQRVERGNGNRERDGQRELAEQNAGGAGEKCDRHKHGHQHQRGCDDGAGHFFHGDRGCLVRVGFAFLDVALDVFDDDDGIVHHQSGGQRDAEQGQRVDREIPAA